MPEDKSQATPQELVTPTSEQVPEPATPQGPVSTQPTEQPKDRPLTLEDVQREAHRIAQSLVAKGETRIQKQIQDKFKALDQTKDALKLTDEQVKQAKQNIVSEAFSEEETPSATQPETTPSSAPGVDDAIAYMNTQIYNAFDEIGTTVTKSDPEFKQLQEVVDASWNDEKGLARIVIAASKAATAKAARLQTTQQGARGRVVGSGASPTPTTPKLSPSAKISQGLKGPYNQGPPPGK